MAGSLYQSGKIPFAFDYVAKSYIADHSSSNSDHGTHVAGIAAGNSATFQGIAPDAQLAIMQVFENGSASWVYILQALEDCAYLGADVVNMSLGSPCGETDYPIYYFDQAYHDMGEVFNCLATAGVNVTASAGNSYASYQGGGLGGGKTTATDLDYGMVGEPSTYEGSVSIAAASTGGSLLPTTATLSAGVSSYSSRGATSDLSIKPELLAPGSYIYSAVDNNTYGLKSGTSMAAPWVAGCMALLRQKGGYFLCR